MNESTSPSSTMSSLLTKLLVSLSTTQEAQGMLETIDGFLEKLYQFDKKDLQEKIAETFDNETGNLLQSVIKEQNIDQTNPEEINKLLILAKEAISKAKILTLTIAHKPTSRTLTTYSEFVKNEFGADVLLELNINPTIIGGAIIVFEGHYIDKSLKKKLDILFEVKKEEIAEYIK